MLAKQTKDQSYFLGTVYAGQGIVLFTIQCGKKHQQHEHDQHKHNRKNTHVYSLSASETRAATVDEF